MKTKIGNQFIPCIRIAVIAVMISFFGLTCASGQNTSGKGIIATATVTATVTKINQKTRELTIKTNDGQSYKIVAGADVQNLAQVKKGDVITAVYTEALAYEVRKHGSTGVATASAAMTAKPGEKPAGAAAQQTTVTVTITAIDTKSPAVTVKGPEGNLETIKVLDPSKLNDLKVGDLVDLTYTEAFAIKVDPATKK